MITAVRTATIQDGKFADAIATAVKVTKYMQEKLGANTQLFRNIGGSVYQIHWVSMYESLAELEKSYKRMEADEGYRLILSEVRQKGLFVGASVVDTFHESIPLG